MPPSDASRHRSRPPLALVDATALASTIPAALPAVPATVLATILATAARKATCRRSG